MLGIDRRAASWTWTAVLVLLLVRLIYQVRITLFIFTLAVLFAYLLSPLVNLLDRVLPGSRSRTPALALAYIIFVGLVIFAASQIGGRVVEQATYLAKHPPQIKPGPIPDAGPAANWLKIQMWDKIQVELGERSSEWITEIPQYAMRFLTVASDLIYLVIIPILAFFFLKDSRVIRQHLLDLVDPGPRRALLDDLLADVHLLLAHYMRALVMLALCTFTAYGIFFAIIGMPYGLLLALLSCLLEFIPMVGPLAASVIVVLIGAVSGSHILALLIFLVAFRFFQDYIVSPHLMGQGVELHPVLVLFGVFAGAEVAGIAGTFLSVPVLALVRIMYLRIRRSRLRSAAD
jgi:predicted PurR-regulated permease PerM